MPSDFNKLVYREVEEHVKSTLGPTRVSQFNKQQWRILMDDLMVQFTRSLVAIVVTTVTRHQQAQAEAQAQAQPTQAAPAEQASPAPVEPAPAAVPAPAESVLDPENKPAA